MKSLSEAMKGLLSKLKSKASISHGSFFAASVFSEVTLGRHEFSQYWHGLSKGTKEAYVKQLPEILQLMNVLHMPTGLETGMVPISDEELITGTTQVQAMLGRYANNALFYTDNVDSFLEEIAARQESSLQRWRQLQKDDRLHVLYDSVSRIFLEGIQHAISEDSGKDPVLTIKSDQDGNHYVVMMFERRSSSLHSKALQDNLTIMGDNFSMIIENSMLSPQPLPQPGRGGYFHINTKSDQYISSQYGTKNH